MESKFDQTKKIFLKYGNEALEIQSKCIQIYLASETLEEFHDEVKKSLDLNHSDADAIIKRVIDIVSLCKSTSSEDMYFNLLQKDVKKIHEKHKDRFTEKRKQYNEILIASRDKEDCIQKLMDLGLSKASAQVRLSTWLKDLEKIIDPNNRNVKVEHNFSQMQPKVKKIHEKYKNYFTEKRKQYNEILIASKDRKDCAQKLMALGLSEATVQTMLSTWLRDLEKIIEPNKWDVKTENDFLQLQQEVKRIHEKHKECFTEKRKQYNEILIASRDMEDCIQKLMDLKLSKKSAQTMLLTWLKNLEKGIVLNNQNGTDENNFSQVQQKVKRIHEKHKERFTEKRKQYNEIFITSKDRQDCAQKLMALGLSEASVQTMLSNWLRDLEKIIEPNKWDVKTENRFSHFQQEVKRIHENYKDQLNQKYINRNELIISAKNKSDYIQKMVDSGLQESTAEQLITCYLQQLKNYTHSSNSKRTKHSNIGSNFPRVQGKVKEIYEQHPEKLTPQQFYYCEAIIKSVDFQSLAFYLEEHDQMTSQQVQKMFQNILPRMERRIAKWKGFDFLVFQKEIRFYVEKHSHEIPEDQMEFGKIILSSHSSLEATQRAIKELHYTYPQAHYGIKYILSRMERSVKDHNKTPKVRKPKRTSNNSVAPRKKRIPQKTVVLRRCPIDQQYVARYKTMLQVQTDLYYMFGSVIPTDAQKQFLEIAKLQSTLEYSNEVLKELPSWKKYQSVYQFLHVCNKAYLEDQALPSYSDFLKTKGVNARRTKKMQEKYGSERAQLMASFMIAPEVLSERDLSILKQYYGIQQPSIPLYRLSRIYEMDKKRLMKKISLLREKVLQSKNNILKHPVIADGVTYVNSFEKNQELDEKSIRGLRLYVYTYLNQHPDELTNAQKKVLKLYFAIGYSKACSSMEIAEKFHLTQTEVQYFILETLRYIMNCETKEEVEQTLSETYQIDMDEMVKKIGNL